MAYITLVINLPAFSLGECNNRVIGKDSIPDILACQELLRGVAGGNYPANVQVTTRSTDPAVATDGGASAQQNNDKR